MAIPTSEQPGDSHEKCVALQDRDVGGRPLMFEHQREDHIVEDEAAMEAIVEDVIRTFEDASPLERLAEMLGGMNLEVGRLTPRQVDHPPDQ